MIILFIQNKWSRKIWN